MSQKVFWLIILEYWQCSQVGFERGEAAAVPPFKRSPWGAGPMSFHIHPRTFCRTVRSCCGGSGVWPVLPAPSEVADATLYTCTTLHSAPLCSAPCLHLPYPPPFPLSPFPPSFLYSCTLLMPPSFPVFVVGSIFCSLYYFCLF